MENLKRRKYLIDTKLQLKHFFLMTLSLFVFYVLIILFAILAPSMMTLYSDASLSEKAEAAQVLLSLHGTIWPAMGVIIILFGMISIFITHKMAGPLYRIKNMLDQVIHGNLAVRIRLRKGDDLHDLAEQINHTVEAFASTLTALEARHEKLVAHVADIREEVNSRELNRDELCTLLNKLDEGEKEIAEILRKYYPPSGQ